MGDKLMDAIFPPDKARFTTETIEGVEVWSFTCGPEPILEAPRKVRITKGRKPSKPFRYISGITVKSDAT